MKIVAPHSAVPELAPTPVAPAVASAPTPMLEIIEKPVPVAVDLEPLRAEFKREIERLEEKLQAQPPAVASASDAKALENLVPLAADKDSLRAEFSKEIQRLEEKILQSNQNNFRLSEDIASLRQTIEELSKRTGKPSLAAAPAPAPAVAPPAPSAKMEKVEKVEKVEKSETKGVPAKSVQDVAVPPTLPTKEPAEPAPTKVAFFGKLWDYLNETAFESPTQKPK